jgi:hypothetical protein
MIKRFEVGPEVVVIHCSLDNPQSMYLTVGMHTTLASGKSRLRQGVDQLDSLAIDGQDLTVESPHLQATAPRYHSSTCCP